MSNINPIKFGVAGQYYKNDSKEDLSKSTEKEQQSTAANQKQVNSSEVLGFMAAQNADMVPVKTQKTVDVSKYVSEDQEARIADFMEGFEADFDEAFNIAAEEFPDLSEEAAVSLALSYINASYEE
ncbi:MAG: hypothetical protein LUH05_00695 [Candidatus Gastranaerophilales bacterium]|nr:hypothetical protein [Candidatus Gastranaerophilales bacterium]